MTFSKIQKGVLIGISILFNMQLMLASVVYEENLYGKSIQIGNLLKWSTAEEIDNQFFIIERSLDGDEFEKIGEVEGIGDSNKSQSYQFLDINVHGERFLYRLRQVDYDGTFSYSEILQVYAKHPNNFMLSKMNGVITNTTFEAILEVFKDGIITYSFSDLKGNVMIERELIAITGFNKINVDLEFQPIGTYKLTFQMEEEIEEIIIQRIEDKTVKNNVVSKDIKSRN